MEVISRKEAKEKGLKYYFTGKPCKNGHVSERHLSNGACYLCAAEMMRKYCEQNKEKILERNRKYREQNKDKAAEYQRRRREQNKDEVAEYQRKYREQNKEKIFERKLRYYKKNKEKIDEYKRKYDEENREKILERSRKWKKANPEQVFIRKSLDRILNNWKGGRAKAEKLLGYTCEQLREHIESQFKEGMSWDDRCEFHIDHIKPIKAFLDEGITDPAIINALDNLQPLWAHENLSKGAKHER